MSTKTFCDFHTDEHEGITREVAIKGEEPFLIDTCQAFVDQLKAHAIPRAELVTVAPAGVETPEPEQDIPAGLVKPSKPTKSKKKTAASNAVAVRPVNVTAKKKPQDHPCPFCPSELTQSGFLGHAEKHGFATARAAMGPHCPLCKAPSGKLTAHARKEHAPFTNGAQLFAAAVEAGDPHGIVAKRRKAATNVVLP